MHHRPPPPPRHFRIIYFCLVFNSIPCFKINYRPNGAWEKACLCVTEPLGGKNEQLQVHPDPPFFVENGELTCYLWDSTVKTRSIFLWLSSSWCSFNCNFNFFTNFPFSTPKKIIFLTFNIDLG